MDTMENNYALANTMINYNNLLENYHRNDILRQMVTELHIGTCQLNGAVKNLANVVGNSIDKQTEALRKRKYVLVDKFYNVYDEVVKMKYDEEKKCFMMFGKNHSWKIFITSDVDEYNFERLNTKLSYSELYDTVITLDYLVNAFGVEYSMDLFNSRINREETNELNELLKKYDNLKSEKQSKIDNHKKELKTLIYNENIIEEERESKFNFYKETLPGICPIISVSIWLMACIVLIILGVCFDVTILWVIATIASGITIFVLSLMIWDYCYSKKQCDDILSEMDKLDKKILELNKKIDTLKSTRTQKIAKVKDEYETKIKKTSSEIKDFVDSFRK